MIDFNYFVYLFYYQPTINEFICNLFLIFSMKLFLYMYSSLSTHYRTQDRLVLYTTITGCANAGLCPLFPKMTRNPCDHMVVTPQPPSFKHRYSLDRWSYFKIFFTSFTMFFNCNILLKF